MISDHDLLAVWEAGLGKPMIERSLLLLSSVEPAYSLSQFAAMSIGERDACLLEVRGNLFGQIFYNTTNCPACSQKVEWEMTVADLWILPPATVNRKCIELEYEGHRFNIKLPNSVDLMEVMAIGERAVQEDELLKKCVDFSALPPALSLPIPDDLKMAIIQKMEECDPQADLHFDMHCPECDHDWGMCFDIMSYLWIELNDWATGLLQDVYLLAKNFGWSERDILEMGQFRRNLYINMLLA